ncbi:unnamed protein product [Arabis nemorensis]|uniref:Uncharacterized protein n=1 Tax=Arabis nemorensis TaxID=586526 RepID=A0A565C3C5_9BRAS|nr:unnamed protein product [Arabis nemorensis]
MVNGCFKSGKVDQAGIWLTDASEERDFMICGLEQNERMGEALVLFKKLCKCFKNIHLCNHCLCKCSSVSYGRTEDSPKVWTALLSGLIFHVDD